MPEADETVVFPQSDATEARRRERELDGRLKLLIELSRIIGGRADLHAGLAQRHDRYWLGSWEAQKA